MPKRILTAAEQVADCLRDELARGRWSGTIPGIHKLSADLGFSRKQVERALLLLEKDGLIISQGKGRKRRVATPDEGRDRPMTVGVLDYDSSGLQERLISELFKQLSEQGHIPKHAARTLADLRMNTQRVGRLVKEIQADIWIVLSAPEAILDWFLDEKIPVFAAFGGFPGRPIAAVGLRYLSSLLEATRQLIGLGHRRVVFLACRGKVRPLPDGLWSRLMREMESHGIQTGPYNLPEWQDNAEGFNKMLQALFEHTPPTALLIEEPVHLVAALQFFSHRGIRVPQDVSIVCMQPGPEFEFCQFPVTYIDWDRRPIIRHMVRWVRHMSLGHHDIRQTYCKSKLVQGGTIAAAP